MFDISSTHFFSFHFFFKPVIRGWWVYYQPIFSSK